MKGGKDEGWKREDGDVKGGSGYIHTYIYSIADGGGCDGKAFRKMWRVHFYRTFAPLLIQFLSFNPHKK